jgi:hypothetical protein
LGFLRAEILTAITVANVSSDVEFALVNANHFDDCNFSGGSAVVSSYQAEAVRSLDPSDPSPEQHARAMLFFGRSLHTLQDFYAHSNWVELGGEVLLDASLTAFPLLAPYATIPTSGFVVIQGTRPKSMALSRQNDAPYPKNAIVTVRGPKRHDLGLISGTVDYEAGDYCPAAVAMSHEELNKDKSTLVDRETQHRSARALATSQTRHEWCRLVALTRSSYGEAGPAVLSAWVADGAAQPDCDGE